jgi:hypothetical protein
MSTTGEFRTRPDVPNAPPFCRLELTTIHFARVIQSYMVFGTTFDVDVQYTVVDAVGQGAYGIVW